MSHTRQAFLIPQLNVISNDAELKNLQHKILGDSYLKQTQHNLNRSQSERMIYKNYSNPENRIDTDYQTLRNSSISQIKRYKKDLAEFYTQQIERKQAKKKIQRIRQLKQQQQMIDRAKYQMYQDRARAIQINQGFKRQAFQLLSDKERRKQEAKRQQKQQKNYFQRQYQTNLRFLNKQKSFQDHYQNVDGALLRNQINYIKNVMPKNRQIQMEKQKLIDKSSGNQMKIRQQAQIQREAAQKLKRSLQYQLVSQIRQKQQKKKMERSLERSQGYTSDPYLRKHHPINNPVDFKITHDNKYIIQELQTGLARRGSQSLLS